MKFIALAFILILSQHTEARQCESFFENRPFQKFARGSEGTVYRDNKIAKKVFEFETSFESTLLLHGFLAEPLSKAGFIIPKIHQLDPQNLTIYREFVAGETLDAFHRKAMAKFATRKSWEQVRESYEELFKKAIANLKKDRRFQFQREISEEHVSVIEGYIVHNGQQHFVRLHTGNIIVRIDPKTKKPQFYIIDYR